MVETLVLVAGPPQGAGMSKSLGYVVKIVNE
jgi:hypothetical protein